MNFDDVLALRPALLIHASRLSFGNPADAADLVQTTLERAWKHRGSYERREHFEKGGLVGWLTQIMRNYHYDTRCKSIAARARAVELTDELHPQYPCRGEDYCRLEECFEALDSLNENQRDALVLALAGFEQPEIAALQGVALGTVKSRVNRAEQAFAQALATS